MKLTILILGFLLVGVASAARAYEEPDENSIAELQEILSSMANMEEANDKEVGNQNAEKEVPGPEEEAAMEKLLSQLSSLANAEEEETGEEVESQDALAMEEDEEQQAREALKAEVKTALQEMNPEERKLVHTCLRRYTTRCKTLYRILYKRCCRCYNHKYRVVAGYKTKYKNICHCFYRSVKRKW